jgi:hypothetical protein
MNEQSIIAAWCRSCAEALPIPRRRTAAHLGTDVKKPTLMDTYSIYYIIPLPFLASFMAYL